MRVFAAPLAPFVAPFLAPFAAPLIALWLSLTPGAADAAPDPEKVLRVALEATDEGFDPVRSVNYYSGVVLEAIGESLLTYDYLADPAKLVPQVAETLPTVEDGGRSYTFHLRQGVLFQPDPAFKGRPRELTAADFVYSFKRFLDPKYRSQWRYLFAGKIVGLDAIAEAAEKTGRFDYDAPVAGLQAPDRYTLKIRLKQPDFNFAYILAMSATMAVAREVVEAYADDLGAHPVGTNAYMLKEYQRERRIVLEANPNYRGFVWDFAGNGDADREIIAALRGKTMPQIGRIEINYIVEEQSKLLAFYDRQIDYVDRIGNVAESWRAGDDIKPELKSRGIRRQDVVDPETTYYFFNFRDPVVGGLSKEQIALRRAIIMAYDKASEIKIARKGLVVANDMPIPRGVVGHDPHYRPVNRYNPAAANKLLDKFGFRRGPDGWRTRPDGSPLLLTMTSEPQSNIKDLDEIWVKSMEKISVRTEIKKSTFAENLKAAKHCQLQIWHSAWTADFPDGENFLALLYGPNSGQSNNGCYDSPIYNTLYEKSIKLPDSPQRNRLYRLMARQMEYDGAWQIGIARLRPTLIHPWVIGYRKHPVLHSPWKYIDLDLAARAAAAKRP